MQQLNKAKEMINIELKYLESKYDDLTFNVTAGKNDEITK